MSNYHSPQFKNPKTAFYILITYIFVFQLSGVIFLIEPVAQFAASLIDAPANQKGAILAAWWQFIVGLITCIIIIVLVYKNRDFFKIYKGETATTPQAIGWGIIGFFLVFFGQTIAINIETLLGIEAGSQNTANLVEIAAVAPMMIITVVLIGPILEEIIFRRVIFGSLLQAQGFWIATLVSAIVFAAVHIDFTHILLYTVCGLIFAYLYYKTKRLLTSIVAHILLNAFVMVYSLNFEKIQQFLDSLPKQ